MLTIGLILGCLVVSGFASLGYEVLWVRMLSLTFGSTHASFAAVLAAFFGGLAIGSAIGGRLSQRLARPLRAYGLIEIAMGVASLALLPVLRNLEAVFSLLDPGPGWGGTALRFLVSSLLLCIPTTLMGMTLPVLSRSPLVRELASGVGTSLMYGVNTLGAFLGVLATTFFLIRELGVAGSVYCIAAMNLLAGAVAIMLERRALPGSQQDTAVTTAAAAAGRSDTASPGGKVFHAGLPVLLMAFCSGFSFLAFEIVWVRIFSNMLGGSLYAVSTVLLVALLGIALGSLLASLAFKRGTSLPRLFAALQLLSVGWILLTLKELDLILYTLASIADISPAGMSPLYFQIGFVFLLLLIPTAAAGAGFPILLHLLHPDKFSVSRPLGRIYAVNTAGSICASVVVGFLVIPRFGSDTALLIGLFLMAATAFLMMALCRGRRDRLPVLLAAAGCTWGFFAFDGFDRQLLSFKAFTDGRSFAGVKKILADEKASTAFLAEGETAVIKVSGRQGMFGMTSNGLGQGGYNLLPPHYPLESLLVAYLPVIHAPPRSEALVVGLGMGATVDALLQLGAAGVTVAELEGKVVDAVNLAWKGKSPLRDGRVKLEVNDARHFLQMNRVRQRQKFGIITSMPAHPWVAASVFTEEFFSIARDSLAEDGVFATWFGWNGDRGTLESLVGSFTRIFPHHVIYEAEETGAFYLLGSGSPLRFDSPRIEGFFDHPALLTFEHWGRPAFLLSQVASAGETRQPLFARRNTDDNAYVEVNYPLHAASDTAHEPQAEDILLAPAGRRVIESGLIVGALAPDLLRQAVMHLLGQDQAGLLAEEISSHSLAKAERMRLEAADSLDARALLSLDAVIAWRRGRLAEFAEQNAARLSAMDQEGLRHLRFMAGKEDLKLAAVEGAPVGVDEIERIGRLDPAGAVEMLPSLEPGPGVSPPLTALRRLAAAGNDDEAARAFKSETVPWALRSKRLGLLNIAALVAERSGLPAMALLLSEQRPALAAVQRDALLRRVPPLLRQGRIDVAIDIYRQAARYAPLGLEALRQLYGLEKKFRGPGNLAALREELVSRGQPRAWIEAFDRGCCRFEDGLFSSTAPSPKVEDAAH